MRSSRSSRIPLAAPQARQRPRARGIPQGDAADVATPSATRSKPAPSGGTASCSPAGPTGRSCSRTPPPALTAGGAALPRRRVEELCAMVTDWETTHVYSDLPPHVWQFIKDKRLPRDDHPEGVRRAGLLRVRALAGDHQAVDALAARSSVTVMVPNSLGPGELLRTTAPTSRSATTCRGSRRASRSPASRSPTRTPARTRRRSPTTASSAGASTKGRRVLGLRVTWDKRYITLGPVATLLGLAFRALRPGPPRSASDEDIGITCALDSDDASGRAHRPPPHAAQRGVPERAQLGQGRLHPDGLDHRRAADAAARAGGC